MILDDVTSHRPKLTDSYPGMFVVRASHAHAWNRDSIADTFVQ
ncbi:MAG: hypothetical protein ABSE92_12070 [Terriglobales bacterium]|jgi:protoporphyrinogen oxidase